MEEGSPNVSSRFVEYFSRKWFWGSVCVAVLIFVVNAMLSIEQNFQYSVLEKLAALTVISVALLTNFAYRKSPPSTTKNRRAH